MNTKNHAEDFSVLLKDSWRIFTANFLSLTGVLFIAFVIFTIFSAVILGIFTVFGINFAISGEALSGGFSAGAAFAFLVLFAVAIFVYSFPILLITHLTEKSLKRQRIDLIEETKKWLPDLPSFVGTLFLATVLLIPLYVLFIIPGIIFSIFWLFTIQEMVFNRHYGFAALSASKRFVQGRWWHVFGFMLLMWAIMTVLSIVFEAMTEGIFSYGISGMLSSIFSLLTGVFGLIFTTIYFTELRKQRGEKAHG